MFAYASFSSYLGYWYYSSLISKNNQIKINLYWIFVYTDKGDKIF